MVADMLTVPPALEEHLRWLKEAQQWPLVASLANSTAALLQNNPWVKGFRETNMLTQVRQTDIPTARNT
jgi:hypothetical protein